MDRKELEDRMSLKELVDSVSTLADRKDYYALVQLFSESAVSVTFAGRTAVLELKGRKEMAEAFSDFLKDIETVYHLNGQHVVTIDGNQATGTSYCLITLIGAENGIKMQTTIGTIYQDEYVRNNRRWLIDKRIGNFAWQEKREVN